MTVKMRFLALLSLVGFAATFVIPNPGILSSADTPSEAHRAANPVDSALGKGIVLEQFLEQVSGRATGLLDWLSKEADAESLGEVYTTRTPLGDQEPSSEERHDYDAASESLDSLGQHEKSHLTIYQLISQCDYTTILAKLVSEDEALVKVLNGTEANYTLFAPTDRAFEKIPDGDDKPSKEFIRELLLLHISDEYYPAKRVLASHTIPTLHEEKDLGGRQRLAVRLGLKGLTVNYFSRVVAINFFGKNGVIHAVDSLILLPPPSLPIIEAIPSAYSTLALALEKTGLAKALKDATHVGSTFFAPSNLAFAKLGGKANAFLFSKYGQKYLKALLKYHVVHNATVYSDAYYHSDEAKLASLPIASGEDDAGYVANGHGGHYHVELPTLLEDHSLSVDIVNWGSFIFIKVNGFVRVTFQDGVTKDGVIHTISNVLIPPKKVFSAEGDVEIMEPWDGVSELTEADLIERLGPHVVDQPSRCADAATEALWISDEAEFEGLAKQDEAARYWEEYL